MTLVSLESNVVGYIQVLQRMTYEHYLKRENTFRKNIIYTCYLIGATWFVFMYTKNKVHNECEQFTALPTTFTVPKLHVHVFRDLVSMELRNLIFFIV